MRTLCTVAASLLLCALVERREPVFFVGFLIFFGVATILEWVEGNQK